MKQISRFDLIFVIRDDYESMNHLQHGKVTTKTAWSFTTFIFRLSSFNLDDFIAVDGGNLDNLVTEFASEYMNDEQDEDQSNGNKVISLS